MGKFILKAINSYEVVARVDHQFLHNIPMITATQSLGAVLKSARDIIPPSLKVWPPGLKTI